MGKRSLGWAFCSSYAAENECSLVLCSKKRTDSKGPPLLTAGSSSASQLWARVQIRYVSYAQEAIQVLLNVQLLSSLPRVLFLEGLDVWFGADGEFDKGCVQSLGLLLSVLVDTLRFCSSKSGQPCVALISVGCCGALPAPFERMLQRWTDVNLKVVRTASGGILSVVDSEKAPSLKFSAEKEQLTLSGFV